MKGIFVFCTIWFTCLLAEGQTTAISADDTATLKFPFIGLSVIPFADSLFCKDYSHTDEPYKKQPGCKSYLLTDASANYRYGNVMFNMVVLFPAEDKTIIGISHFKSKLRDDPANEDLEKDTRLLTAYFNEVFEAKGVSKKEKVGISKREEITWKKNGIRLVVTLSSFKRDKKRNVLAILSLDIWKE